MHLQEQTPHQLHQLCGGLGTRLYTASDAVDSRNTACIPLKAVLEQVKCLLNKHKLGELNSAVKLP